MGTVIVSVTVVVVNALDRVFVMVVNSTVDVNEMRVLVTTGVVRVVIVNVVVDGSAVTVDVIVVVLGSARRSYVVMSAEGAGTVVKNGNRS